MMKRIYLTAVLVLLLARGGAAVEVVLREQAAPAGPLVRLGDLAEVRSEGDSAAQTLAATPLMPTPRIGQRRVLRTAQVRELLLASGVDVRELSFSGSTTIAVAGPLEAPQNSQSTTPASAASAASHPAVREQAAAAINQYLRQQSGHDMWEVRILPDRDLSALGHLRGVAATVSGGKAPWTGRQRFTIAGAGKAAAVTAEVDRVEMVAVALRTVERGDLVRTADVELRPLAGGAPGQAVSSLDSAVAKEAVQTIRAGAVVLSSQLRAPLVVRRGERVTVRAKAAGITVCTFATAQQDGSVGDLVAVTPLDSKERFVGRITGVRELEVFAAGTSASDVAANLH